MVSTAKLLQTANLDPALFEIYFKDQNTPYIASTIYWGRQITPETLMSEGKLLWEAIEMFRNNIELHQEELEQLENFYFQFYGDENEKASSNDSR